MPRSARRFLVPSLVLVSIGAWAQDSGKSEPPHLVARLSYESSGTFPLEGVRHVCLTVSSDGSYRMVRSAGVLPTVRLRGKMGNEQLQTLIKLLGAEKFRSLSGDYGGGLIRRQAETFIAENLLAAKPAHPGIPQDSGPQAKRVQGLNADGTNPFPDSVAIVVDWLGQFQPKDGKTFEYSDFPDVCPSGGLRLLQPTIAVNRP